LKKDTMGIERLLAVTEGARADDVEYQVVGSIGEGLTLRIASAESLS
jgi:hypothetical protein